MTFKMKGWSGYQNSPTKHTLQGNESHVHNNSFDVDTSEDKFTKDDKRTYVTKKVEKTKKLKTEKVKTEKPKKKKKKKKGNLKKWLRKNISIRGGTRPSF